MMPVRTCCKGINLSSQRELSGKIGTLLKQNSEAASSLVEIMLGSWPDRARLTPTKGPSSHTL